MHVVAGSLLVIATINTPYNYREVLGITALEHGSVHPVQLKCIVGTLLHSPHAAALSLSGPHDICSPEALNQRHHLCLRWTGMFG